MLSDLKFNSANLKVSAKPIVTLVLIVIIGIVVLKLGISKVTASNQSLKDKKSEELMLGEKLDGLKKNPLGSLESANSLVVALPEKNPIMAMISQIKRFSIEEDISVGKLEVSNVSSDADMNSVQLAVGLSSNDLARLLNFVNKIPEFAPVSNIYEVKVGPVGTDSFQALLSMNVFWSKFPETIPSVSDPVKVLTEDETKILEAISRLIAPEYQTLDPISPVERPNPFE